MWTLKEREVFTDRLWESLVEQTTDDDEMEIIRAIELNYKCIELLREKKRVLDHRHKMRRAEQERRWLLYERDNMIKPKKDIHCRVIVCIMILICLIFLWACAGCQTLGGACRDIESAAKYGHEHLSVDE